MNILEIAVISLVAIAVVICSSLLGQRLGIPDAIVALGLCGLVAAVLRAAVRMSTLKACALSSMILFASLASMLLTNALGVRSAVVVPFLSVALVVIVLQVGAYFRKKASGHS